jgi:8-oxo-dGTP pyrophosphatase MutT (NUDIX family)
LWHKRDILKYQLQHHLPGEVAQFMMAPKLRKKISANEILKETYTLSAVIILICFDESESPYLILIERVAYNGLHSGQISFPGGKFDTADVTLEITALRECYEEIGIKNNVEVLGKLSDVYIPVSKFMVQPYVAICSKIKPTFIAQEREVKSILKLPLDFLFDESKIKHGLFKTGSDFITEAPYFLFNQHKIWGATAMILSELKVILKQ